MDNDCLNCIPMEKATQLESKVNRLEEELNGLKNQMARSDERFIALKDSLDRIERVIQGLADEVKQITMQPARKWDTITNTVLVGLITAVITYVGTVVFAK